MAGNAESGTGNSLKRRSPDEVRVVRASDSAINLEINHMFDSSANHEGNNGGMSYATLIPVRMGEIGGEAVRVCNAKDIFLCLCVRSRFNDWITRRISEYGFIENEDFVLVTPEKVTKGRGGDRRSKRYDVSLDMAKELALVERGEVGQRIRRYFIECEKALRQIAPEVAADCLRKALNPQQQFTLKGKVDSKVACLAKARQRAGYKELWSSLKARHQVAQYRDIAQAEFEDACQYVDAFVWDGEFIAAEKPAKSERPKVISQGQRFLGYLDTSGVECWKEIPEDAAVLTQEQFINGLLVHCDIPTTADEMFRIAQLALANVQQRNSTLSHLLREARKNSSQGVAA